MEKLKVDGKTLFNMNNLVHIFQTSFKNICYKPNQVVMIGLDNSGKTTLLYRLKLRHSVGEILPTSAFNVESINLKRKVNLNIWDISGSENLRPLWKTYVRKSDGIIFVLDSCDPNRFEEAKVELENVLNSKDAEGIPLLILANKQDKSGSLSPIELSKKLNLDSLDNSIRWHIHGVSGLTGDGLEDSLLEFSVVMNEYRKVQKQENESESSHLKGCFTSIEASKFI